MNIESVIELSKNNDFLLGLLFINLTQSESSPNFYVYSQYANKTVILPDETLTEREIEQTHNEFIEKTGGTWVIPEKGKKHLWNIYNPNKKSYLSVYNEILTIVRSKTNINISDFIAGAFSCRASLDQNRNCVTIDYWYKSGKYELETKTRALLNIMPLDALSAVFPINFRQLQDDYQDGHKRETQFRIKANWFFENSYLINPFKQKSLEKIASSLSEFQSSKNTPELLGRVQTFSNIIYENEDLTKENIDNYRQRLNFDNDTPLSNIRSRRLVDLAWELLPDECASCYTQYSINHRTFLSKKRNGRPYLEVHHIISLGKNEKLDAEFNLSKLCPACHKSLGRGYASDEYQKEVIENILDFDSTDTESIKLFLDITDKQKLIDTIQNKLL